MTKLEITNQIEEALSLIDKAASLLNEVKQKANDSLTDDNGKDIEREYNSAYNALIELENAKKELTKNSIR